MGEVQKRQMQCGGVGSELASCSKGLEIRAWEAFPEGLASGCTALRHFR